MQIIAIIMVLSIPFTVILSAIAAVNLREYLIFKEKTKQYSFYVSWHKDDDSWIGECYQFPGLTGYGTTPEKAISEIKKVVRFGDRLLEEKENGKTDLHEN